MSAVWCFQLENFVSEKIGNDGVQSVVVDVTVQTSGSDNTGGAWTSLLANSAEESVTASFATHAGWALFSVDARWSHRSPKTVLSSSSLNRVSDISSSALNSWLTLGTNNTCPSLITLFTSFS